MKKIQVLGPGCRKCHLLAETAEQAAQSLKVEYTLEKVTNLSDIAALGVMFTPALVVDGAVKVSGRVPSLDEVKRLLS